MRVQRPQFAAHTEQPTGLGVPRGTSSAMQADRCIRSLLRPIPTMKFRCFEYFPSMELVTAAFLGTPNDGMDCGAVEPSDS
jgi:hypothetical protein